MTKEVALSSNHNSGERLGRELSTAIVLFHEAIAARLGIGAAEWRCLTLLGEVGATTAGRLAELSGFTTGAITGIVDRLERAGYARREPNPEDRRSVIVRPLRSEEIAAKVDPIFKSLGRSMGDLNAGFTPDQLIAIAGYLQGMTAVLREETAKQRDRR